MMQTCIYEDFEDEKDFQVSSWTCTSIYGLIFTLEGHLPQGSSYNKTTYIKFLIVVLNDANIFLENNILFTFMLYT